MVRQALLKVEKSGKRHKGGYTPYSSIKKQIKNFLGDSSLTYVTTMFDYYALYEDFPGMDSPISGKAYEKVAFLEERKRRHIEMIKQIQGLQNEVK